MIVSNFGDAASLLNQREYLEIMNCYGDSKANKLAKIIGATVLAANYP